MKGRVLFFQQGLIFPMRHQVLLPNPLYYNSELGHRPLCAMPVGDHGLAVPSMFESWFAQPVDFVVLLPLPVHMLPPWHHRPIDWQFSNHRPLLHSVPFQSIESHWLAEEPSAHINRCNPPISLRRAGSWVTFVDVCNRVHAWGCPWAGHKGTGSRSWVLGQVCTWREWSGSIAVEASCRKEMKRGCKAEKNDLAWWPGEREHRCHRWSRGVMGRHRERRAERWRLASPHFWPWNYRRHIIFEFFWWVSVESI